MSLVTLPEFCIKSLVTGPTSYHTLPLVFFFVLLFVLHSVLNVNFKMCHVKQMENKTTLSKLKCQVPFEGPSRDKLVRLVDLRFTDARSISIKFESSMFKCCHS